MSFGTFCNCELYLSRELYKTKEELEEKIREEEEYISQLRQQICMYIASTPKDIYLKIEGEDGDYKEGDCIMLGLSYAASELLNEYEDAIRLQDRRSYVLENFDKKEDDY
jgi:hypothetical protein